MTTYLKFETNDCQACKMADNFIKGETTITQEVLTDENIDLATLESKLYTVNAEELPTLAGQFEVFAVPTFIKLIDGEEVERFSGFQPPKFKQIEKDLIQ